MTDISQMHFDHLAAQTKYANATNTTGPDTMATDRTTAVLHPEMNFDYNLPYSTRKAAALMDELHNYLRGGIDAWYADQVEKLEKDSAKLQVQRTTLVEVARDRAIAAAHQLDTDLADSQLDVAAAAIDQLRALRTDTTAKNVKEMRTRLDATYAVLLSKVKRQPEFILEAFRSGGLVSKKTTAGKKAPAVRPTASACYNEHISSGILLLAYEAYNQWLLFMPYANTSRQQYIVPEEPDYDGVASFFPMVSSTMSDDAKVVPVSRAQFRRAIRFVHDNNMNSVHGTTEFFVDHTLLTQNLDTVADHCKQHKKFVRGLDNTLVTYTKVKTHG